MRRTITATAVAITVACVALLPTVSAVADVSDDPVPGKLLLMLDASGSMKAKDPSGLTKIEAAKKALTGVVGALPDTAQVGLRVYGATVDGKGKPTPAACADTQLITPIGTIDKPALTSAISAINALGETPIAHSLTEALKDLGPTGKRNIVLVSDGEESCTPDPCPAVKKLTAGGVDLQIDTVGFGVNAKARSQLQCIADAGKGTYYDAKDAPALAASLSKLSQRALRPFTVTGTPITATSTPETAPVVTPGQYTDTVTTGAAQRYYKVRRTAGSTIRFSITARPPANPEDYSSERLDIEARLPDGTRCEGENALRFDPGQRTEAVVSAMRIAGPKDADDTDDCAVATEFQVSVHRPKGAPGEVPVEVLYVEEPPVTNASSLPPALQAKDVTPLIAPATGAGAPVVGGGGFSDALTLQPGTYSDVILPGEQIFYRVRVGYGQRAGFTVDAPTPGQTLTMSSTSYTAFAVDAYTSWRYPISRTSSKPANAGSIGPSGASIVLGEYTPEVRYLNREAPGGSGQYSFVPLREVSLPGFYYFALGRSAEKAGADSAVPVTVRLRVAVEGETTGTPAYAGAAPVDPASPNASPEPTPSTGAEDATAAAPRTDDPSPSPLPWVLGGLVVVLGLAAVTTGLLRRRTRGHDDTLVAADDQPGGGSQA
ncbi:putative secreted protein [Janibacter sp. HTCC2649]|uniref:vWA domain-containing protein n=1 Tax=Janibacter sp. HTCC2649 TaxID=313589 RepID=UPI0000670EBB|nr:VWA domain-containing protein [Janibacter sp. HTCC2649]EAP97461.1 putative secreted protein [Janibacter sp. HTCC2649]